MSKLLNYVYVPLPVVYPCGFRAASLLPGEIKSSSEPPSAETDAAGPGLFLAVLERSA